MVVSRRQIGLSHIVIQNLVYKCEEMSLSILLNLIKSIKL